MRRLLLLSLTLSLFALPALSFADAPKQAVFVSYQTPGSMDGRLRILHFLKERDFGIQLVSDRFPEITENRYEPTPESFIAAVTAITQMTNVRELLIITDMHGEPRRSGERTHSIHFGERFLSLDYFLPILDALRARGIIVAWMDFSCFSGASLPLGETGACVSTNGSAREPTWPQFVPDYADALGAGRTFEDVYLRTRGRHRLPGAPAISTASGLALAESLATVDEIQEFGTTEEIRAREATIRAQPWNPSEKVLVDETFREMAAENASVPSATGGFELILRINRFVPLATAERALYAREYVPAPRSSACRRFRF